MMKKTAVVTMRERRLALLWGPGPRHVQQHEEIDLCESLYADTGLLAPSLRTTARRRSSPADHVNGDSSVTGLAFYQGGNYPAAYGNALFLSGTPPKLHLGHEDRDQRAPGPTKIETFIAAAGNPVALEIGPNGDVFYVDFEGGAVHRITSAPATRRPSPSIVATPTSGPRP